MRARKTQEGRHSSLRRQRHDSLPEGAIGARAAANLRNFPEAQDRNFRAPLSPLALLIVRGWGSYYVVADIRLGLVARQEPSLFVDCLHAACCDRIDADRHQSLSRHSLVGGRTFPTDYQFRTEGRPSPARGFIRSEPGRPAHRSQGSAPSGSAQFA
jgi:hypothetical protein